MFKYIVQLHSGRAGHKPKRMSWFLELRSKPALSPLEMVFSLQEGSSGDRGAVLGCTNVYAYCSGLRCLRWYQNAGHCCVAESFEGQVPVWPRMSNSTARQTEHHILIWL